ncbi:MAG TPA: serpin family protein, partial [Longimicrobiales bacterium]
WSKAFDARNTRPTPFTRSDGSRVDVPMMWRESSYPIARTSDVVAVELPYADSAYSIVLVMPAQGTALSAAESYLTDAKWEALLALLHTNEVLLGVPKFHIEYSVELNDILKNLGMGVAFEPNVADFTRISTRDDMYISRVFQKAFIDVNEEGTEAAAATGVGMGVTSAPMPLAYDRPFLFAIRERSTGTILFAGRVTDPSVR